MNNNAGTWPSRFMQYPRHWQPGYNPDSSKYVIKPVNEYSK
nr:hypothetical protein [Mycoplasmopsis bovis]